MIYDEIVRLREKLAGEKNIHDVAVCCIEEMSEATKVLTKYLRCSDKFNVDDLVEEVAHAQLMLDMVKNSFHLDDEAIALEQLRALQKAIKRRSDGEQQYSEVHR